MCIFWKETCKTGHFDPRFMNKTFDLFFSKCFSQFDLVYELHPNNCVLFNIHFGTYFTQRFLEIENE